MHRGRRSSQCAGNEKAENSNRLLALSVSRNLSNRQSRPRMRSVAQQPRQIVIIGAGIIGLCCANSLLKSPLLPPNSTVTIIENVGIASAASGKAGGFISRDWPESTDLARLSWLEHVALAEKYDGGQKWGWRECGAVGLRVGSLEEDVERSAYRALPEGAQMKGESWLNGEREDMSGSGGIAQLYVRPR